MHRLDFRQHLALLDPIVLFDKETHQPARNHFGSDVDDAASTKASSVMEWERR